MRKLLLWVFLVFPGCVLEDKSGKKDDSKLLDQSSNSPQNCENKIRSFFQDTANQHDVRIYFTDPYQTDDTNIKLSVGFRFVSSTEKTNSGIERYYYSVNGGHFIIVSCDKSFKTKLVETFSVGNEFNIDFGIGPVQNNSDLLPEGPSLTDGGWNKGVFINKEITYSPGFKDNIRIVFRLEDNDFYDLSENARDFETPLLIFNSKKMAKVKGNGGWSPINIVD